MADEAMSEATDGARAPFALICTEWGADIDAPDQEFFVGSPAFVPHANHLLVSVRCLTCETDHDVALWTVDQPRFISEAGSGMVEAAADADALALVEHYHALVAACPVELDLSTLDVAIGTDRFAALPMAAPAAARGLRLAVAARPGVQPPAVLLLGPYRCIVSFDQTPERPYPYALHVSVGNDTLPGTPPKLELHWLLSLFVIPGEMPFVEAEPGQTDAVTLCRHLTVRTDVGRRGVRASVNECGDRLDKAQGQRGSNECLRLQGDSRTRSGRRLRH